jgi:Protein of unknown function (DUF2933)
MLAATGIASVLPFLLVLACPLMMVFMMRGMHGHGDRRHSGEPRAHGQLSLDELKMQCDALNDEIGRRVERRATSRRRQGEAT